MVSVSYRYCPLISLFDGCGRELVSRGQTAISPSRRLSIRDYKRLLLFIFRSRRL